MIDIKTLEKLFQLQFEEGEVTITQLDEGHTEERQNIMERFLTFITGKRYYHTVIIVNILLRLDWTISDKENYNMCFTADILDSLDSTNAMDKFVRPQSLKLKIARDRNIKDN